MAEKSEDDGNGEEEEDLSSAEGAHEAVPPAPRKRKVTAPGCHQILFPDTRTDVRLSIYLASLREVFSIILYTPVVLFISQP